MYYSVAEIIIIAGACAFFAGALGALAKGADIIVDRILFRKYSYRRIMKFTTTTDGTSVCVGCAHRPDYLCECKITGFYTPHFGYCGKFIPQNKTNQSLKRDRQKAPAT